MISTLILLTALYTEPKPDVVATLSPYKMEYYTWNFDCSPGYVFYYKVDAKNFPKGMPDHFSTEELRKHNKAPWHIAMCEIRELNGHRTLMQDWPEWEELLRELNPGHPNLSSYFAQWISFYEEEGPPESFDIILWIYVPRLSSPVIEPFDIKVRCYYFTEEEKARRRKMDDELEKTED